MRVPAAGVHGGASGAVSRIEVNGKPIAPTSSPEFPFNVGDTVRLALPGGGGNGDPRKRTREAIAADLKNGYVTREGAKRDYGYDE